MLQTIKSANEFLDLHGGLSAASGLQQFHLKELRGSSPRSNSARQKMKHATEAATMSKAEYERLKQQVVFGWWSPYKNGRFIIR